mgnify:CR=1 FL=1
MKLYNDYGNWIRNKFGYRVQKISIDAGFSCPNRDGSIGKGGCIYCNNASFSPSYCSDTANRQSQEEMLNLETDNIRRQLRRGKQFFDRKYPDMKYIAYFQSFTNTYGPIARLKALYEAALNEKDVVGISIATRPDCVSDETLDYLETLSKKTFLTMEYGVESLNDKTLQIINRGHDSSCSINIIRNTHARGITTCAHLILGLPDENEDEILRQVDIVNSLPIDILKLHQLQITRGTLLEKDVNLQKRCTLFSPEEYIQLIGKYIKKLRPEIVLERFTSQSPSDLLIAPRWGLKNYEFTNLLEKHLSQQAL